MTAILLIAGAVLVFTVLGVVYRIITLVGIAKGDTEKRVGFSNKVNAFLFPVVFIVGFGAIFWYSGVAQEYFLPEAASEHGKATDQLFWITMAVVGAAFLVTHVLLFFFPYVYQYSEKRAALFYPENHNLELIWTIIPAIVMAVLVVSGWMVWSDVTSPAPKEALEIEIMGRQFAWQARYGGQDNKIGRHDFRKIDATNVMGMDFKDKNCMDDFIPREIRLPKGQPVHLKIRSRDVLHSVFLPHFRVKMDAVPGMPTKFWFVPTKTTAEMREELSKEAVWNEIDAKTGEPRWKNFNYELACTEVCGGSHFAMRMVVIVEEPTEYQKWASTQKPWAEQNADYVASVMAKDDKQLAQAN